MDNILLYSQLSIAARKELMYRAATQFALYMGNLLDGLPTGVVLVARSSKEKEQGMTVNTTNTAPADTKTTAEPTTTTNTEQLSRADITALIAEGIAAALATAKPAETTDSAPVTRSDAPASTPAPAAATTEALAPVMTSLETLTRSLTEAMTEIKNIGTRVNSIESTTVVRSDTADSGTTPATPASRDLFSGVFSRSMK